MDKKKCYLIQAAACVLIILLNYLVFEWMELWKIVLMAAIILIFTKWYILKIDGEFKDNFFNSKVFWILFIIFNAAGIALSNGLGETVIESSRFLRCTFENSPIWTIMLSAAVVSLYRYFKYEEQK